ncbi:hypothetical protein Tco_0932778 [Tanacetum coccineum]
MRINHLAPSEYLLELPRVRLYQRACIPGCLVQRKDRGVSGGQVDMDLFNLISAPNPTKVKIGTRPRAAHEVPLLTVTASRVIEMEDAVVASESLGTPSTIEKSPLDFANEDPPKTITERGGTKVESKTKLPMKSLHQEMHRPRGSL